MPWELFFVRPRNDKPIVDRVGHQHDCVGGLAPDMDIIADAVRIGFVKTHEAQPIGEQSAMPLERFREAVLMALPDGVELDPLARARGL